MLVTFTGEDAAAFLFFIFPKSRILPKFNFSDKNPFFMATLLTRCALLICFVLTAWTTNAQTEDLTRDIEFFREQTKTYQRWLEHAGLGQYLSVYDIEVKEKELNLFLSFPFSDVDSIMTAWEALKAQFESASPLSLEQQLFYKATTLMEVRQQLVSVQLYDTYDLRETPLFMRAIYFEDGQVRIEESNPRDKRRAIQMQPRPANDGKTPSVEDFQRRYSREKVYECIYEYARNRYEQDKCEDRYPRVRLLEDQEVLRFEVSDLCREVLTNQSDPVLSRILNRLGYPANWAKRELLTFTITHESTTNGFRLILLIDGKYGSGFYSNVRRGGYLSMEIDFDTELELYADELTVQLRRMLLNCE